MENAAELDKLIEQFVEQSAIQALSRFVGTEDKNEAIEEDEEAKEKIDNTKNEKTMKETVSIPKIVQPIT